MRKGRPVPVLLFALLVVAGFLTLHLWLDARADRAARDWCENVGTWHTDVKVCEVAGE